MKVKNAILMGGSSLILLVAFAGFRSPDPPPFSVPVEDLRGDVAVSSVYFAEENESKLVALLDAPVDGKTLHGIADRLYVLQVRGEVLAFQPRVMKDVRVSFSPPEVHLRRPGEAN